eukprot:7745410-Alexandrium_andersonii.AAC.1
MPSFLSALAPSAGHFPQRATRPVSGHKTGLAATGVGTCSGCAARDPGLPPNVRIAMGGAPSTPRARMGVQPVSGEAGGEWSQQPLATPRQARSTKH